MLMLMQGTFFTVSHSIINFFPCIIFCLLKVNNHLTPESKRYFSIGFISTLVGCIMLTAHMIKIVW